MSRTKQLGIAQAYLILIVLAVISLALWYVYQTIDGRAYSRGKDETEAKYAKRDNEALKAANARIQALQTEARAIEAMRNAEMTAITDKYQKDKANDIAHKDRVISVLRDGTAKLYVTLANNAPVSCGSQNSEIIPGARGTAGARGSGVLAEVDSAFLVSEASRADRIAGKLAACQSVIQADRK